MTTTVTASSIRRTLGPASLALLLGAAAPAAAQAPATAEKVKTAGEAYKNVQVLKDAPADLLVPTMQFIAASLGVECSHCHVPRQPEKDDRDAKRTARKMMQMMTAINDANFHGAREVTCYSCHRGAIEPASIPAIATAESGGERERGRGEGGAAPTAVPLPSPDQVLERWVQASGGAKALGAITSRVQKGTLSGFGGRDSAVMIYAKAPNKRVSVVATPRGDSITAYDGTKGWLAGGRGAHEMSAAEAEAASLDADMALPLHLKDRLPDVSVTNSEVVDGQSATVLIASRGKQPPVKLYFDQQSGQLIRLVRYAETALGFNPTQIDYADYRAVDGVQVPFRWTVGRPGGAFTIQVQETQHNVPVDDSRFVMPVQPPPTEEQRRPA